MGSRSLGDRELVTLGVGRLFPRGRATPLGWQQCGELVLAPKVALCLLKAEKNSKGKSIHRRRLLAGWKNEYLLSVLAQVPEITEKSGA